MPKKNTLTAYRLARTANLKVKYDLPLGSSNHFSKKTHKNSKDISKLWVRVNIGHGRGYLHKWFRDQTGHWKVDIDIGVNIEKRTPLLNLTDQSKWLTLGNSAQLCIKVLTESLIHKAGNCREMSLIVMLRLADLMVKKQMPDGTGRLELYALFRVDHATVKITLNKQKVICDPWLHFAFVITDKNLQRYKERLLDALPKHDCLVLNMYWDRICYDLKLDTNIQPHHDIAILIDTQEKAKEFLALHDSYHRANLKRHSFFPSPSNETKVIFDGVLAELKDYFRAKQSKDCTADKAVQSHMKH